MESCDHPDIYAHNHKLKPPELPVRFRSQSARAISYAWLSLPNILHLHGLVMYGISRADNKAERDKVKLMQDKEFGTDRGHQGLTNLRMSAQLEDSS